MGYLGYPSLNGSTSCTQTSFTPQLHSGNYTGPGWGWGTYILPYLEQANLYNQIQPGVNETACGDTNPSTGQPASIPTNTWTAILQIEQTVLPAFVCPSATDPDLVPTQGTQGNGNVCNTTAASVYLAKSNYVGVCGLNYDGVNTPADAVANGYNGAYATNTNTHGMFGDGMEYCMRIPMITDGASNSLAIGEVYYKHVSNPCLCTVNSQSATHPQGDYNGGNWFGIAPDQRQAAVVRCLIPPTAPPTYGVNTGGKNSFASMHTGGAQFLAADGHVVFISQNMDWTLLSLLGQVDDGNAATIP